MYLGTVHLRYNDISFHVTRGYRYKQNIVTKRILIAQVDCSMIFLFGLKLRRQQQSSDFSFHAQIAETLSDN